MQTKTYFGVPQSSREEKAEYLFRGPSKSQRGESRILSSGSLKIAERKQNFRPQLRQSPMGCNMGEVKGQKVPESLRVPWCQGSKVPRKGSTVAGFQGSRVPIPDFLSKVPRSRAPRFDRCSRSAKFQSSRVPGEPRFQKCKVSKFQGSSFQGSRFQDSRVPGFLVQVASTLPGFQGSKSSRGPGFQKFPKSRSFKVPGLGFQGFRVAGFQGSSIPRFQGSRVPRFQGSRVPGSHGVRAPRFPGFQWLQGFQGFQGFRVPGSQQGFRFPGLQGSKVPGFEGCRVPESLRVPGCQGSKVSGFHGRRVPGFQGSNSGFFVQGSKVQGSKVRPVFQKCEISKFQGSRGAEVPEVQSFKVPGFQCSRISFQG